MEFDTNCEPTREQTVYIKENNTTDYMQIVDENGNYVECMGTDSYCRMLAHALLLEDYEDPGERCIIEEVGFATLPEKVKEELK